MITGLETVADTLIPFINENDTEAVDALRALDKHIDNLEHENAQRAFAYGNTIKRAEKAESELLELKAALFDTGWHKPCTLDF